MKKEADITVTGATSTFAFFTSYLSMIECQQSAFHASYCRDC